MKVRQRRFLRARRATVNQWSHERQGLYFMATNPPKQAVLSSKHIDGPLGEKVHQEALSNFRKAKQRAVDFLNKWSLALEGVDR